VDHLVQKVIDWATEKGIFVKGTIPGQTAKFLEEVEEFKQEVECYQAMRGENLDEIKLEMGDVIVTLILLAEMHGFKFQEALEAAYNKISSRKGKMVNGQFVKEAH